MTKINNFKYDSLGEGNVNEPKEFQFQTMSRMSLYAEKCDVDQNVLETMLESHDNMPGFASIGIETNINGVNSHKAEKCSSPK